MITSTMKNNNRIFIIIEWTKLDRTHIKFSNDEVKDTKCNENWLVESFQKAKELKNKFNENMCEREAERSDRQNEKKLEENTRTKQIKLGLSFL